MRVRYGKPIKVKSLAGDQTHITKGSSYTWVGLKNNYFGNMNSGTNIICPIVSGNRYFYAIHCPTHDLSSYNPAFGQTGSSSYGPGNLVSLGNSWYGLAFTSTRDIETFNGIGVYYSWTDIFDSMIIDAYFILDLTNTELETLTTLQLNKYNKYFPLIATGEEITIDDKAGQISISRLPNEYQEVEYIEGTGTQYMREWTLNKTYTGNLTVGYKFTATEHTNAMYFSTITANLSEGQAYSLGYTTANSPLYIRWNQIANNTTKVTYTIPEICEVSRTNAINNTTLVHVSLFCHSTNYKPWKGRIYKYWLKIDDDYIFDFIPCYRKSDNEIGLYDLVGKQFYTNQGTGTFTKGNNVNDTISCKVAGGSSDIYYGYNQTLNPHSVFGNGGISGWYFSNPELWEHFDGYSTCSPTQNGSFMNGRSNNNQIANPVSGHKIIVFADLKSNKTCWICFYYFFKEGGYIDSSHASNHDEWNQVYAIGTSNGSNYFWSPHFRASPAFTKGDYISIRNLQVVDLTNWFGAGKEPTSLAEFREKFTKEIWGYCPTPIKLTRYQIEALPSYGYNQLIKNGDFSNGTSDWTRVGEGTISIDNNKMKLTVSGWKGYSAVGTNSGINYVVGHKYLFRIKNIDLTNLNCSSIWTTKFELTIIAGTATNQWVERIYNKTQPPSNVNYEKILTANSNSSWINGNGIGVYVVGKVNEWSGYITIDNAQVIDLTDWYGAGNEPTTIEEFKQTFPNLYYPYSKKRLLNKYMINKLVS